jgi:hypothetical protein
MIQCPYCLDEVEVDADGLCHCDCGANFYPTSGLYTSPGAIAEAAFDWDADDDEPLANPDDDLEF